MFCQGGFLSIKCFDAYFCPQPFFLQYRDLAGLGGGGDSSTFSGGSKFLPGGGGGQ